MKQFAIYKTKTSVEKVLGVERELKKIDKSLHVEHTTNPAQVWATAPDYWPVDDQRLAEAGEIMAAHFAASSAAATLGSIKSDRKAASSRENGKKGGRPCNHRAGNGRASDYDRKLYCPGDECASCGCTLGTDWYWYVDRDQAPGYPDFK